MAESNENKIHEMGVSDEFKELNNETTNVIDRVLSLHNVPGAIRDLINALFNTAVNSAFLEGVRAAYILMASNKEEKKIPYRELGERYGISGTRVQQEDS